MKKSAILEDLGAGKRHIPDSEEVSISLAIALAEKLFGGTQELGFSTAIRWKLVLMLEPD